MSNSSKVQKIQGRAVVLRGNDIDTDRIIPARFLRCVTFDGLGDHAFEDDRLQDPNHAFNQEANAGASVLVVDDNFGCGSSREHAPVAIKASGIACVVAKSFARIFYRNAINIGLSIVECDVEADDGDQLSVDFEKGTIENLTKGTKTDFAAFPPFLQNLLESGGLLSAVKEGKL